MFWASINKFITFKLRLLPFFIISIGSSALAVQYYRVVSGAAATTITAFSVCYQVYNGQALDIFVPVNTAAEWASFYNNAPANVVLCSCTAKVVGGFCWYASAVNANCNATCSSSAYNSATLTYAGSSGTAANCKAVLDALGEGTTGNTPGGGGTAGCGCEYTSNAGTPARYLNTTATTAACAESTGVRACACNQ